MFKKLFKRDPVYVVRNLENRAEQMYLGYAECYRDHGFNVGPLKYAKHCHTLNRARKDAKRWFNDSGYEIRRLRCFGLFTTLVEQHIGMFTD